MDIDHRPPGEGRRRGHRRGQGQAPAGVRAPAKADRGADRALPAHPAHPGLIQGKMADMVSVYCLLYTQYGL